MTTTETTDHVDAAYQAIRTHLHERPYDQDPSRVYRDLGALDELLSSIRALTDQMLDAVGRATGADDDCRDSHVAYASTVLNHQITTELATARHYVELVHGRVGHLIFGERAS